MKRVFMYATALTLTLGMSLAMTSCKSGAADDAANADSTTVEQTTAPAEAATTDSSATMAADSSATMADSSATMTDSSAAM